jgi:hypothetical protein
MLDSFLLSAPVDALYTPARSATPSACAVENSEFIRDTEAPLTLATISPVFDLPIVGISIEEPSEELETTYEMSSVLKKRRRKMNRHKYKKWRKRMKYKLRAQGR